MEETGESHRPVASDWQTLSHNVVSSGRIVKILYIFLSFVDNVTWWCSSKEIFQEGLDKWKTYNNYKQYVAVLWKYQPKRTLVMQLQLEICCWQKSLHICCDICFNRQFTNCRFHLKKKKNCKSCFPYDECPSHANSYILYIFKLVNQIKNSQSNKFTIAYMSSETCYFQWNLHERGNFTHIKGK